MFLLRVLRGHMRGSTYHPEQYESTRVPREEINAKEYNEVYTSEEIPQGKWVENLQHFTRRMNSNCDKDCYIFYLSISRPCLGILHSCLLRRFRVIPG